MARNYSPNDASELARWHMSLMSRLKAAASTPPYSNVAEIQAAYRTLSSGGFFDRSFQMEAEKGIDPLSNKTGMSRLVTNIYVFRRATQLINQCRLLLNSNESEINKLLQEIEPAYKGFTWNFLSAHTKMTAENACTRLTELKETGYANVAISVLDELDSLSGVSSDVAWDDFLGDRDGYRSVLVQYNNMSASNTRIARCANELVNRVEKADKRLSNIKALPQSIVLKVKKSAEEMLSKRAVQMLDDVPIEDIGRQKPGIKTQVLRNCGYATVGSLRNVRADKLSRSTGLSLSAAKDVVHAVESLGDLAVKSARVRLSVDSKTPEATRLVCSLYDVFIARDFAEAADELRSQNLLALKGLVSTLKRTGDCRIWPFKGDYERSHALKAYRNAIDILDSGYEAAIVKLVEDSNAIDQRPLPTKAKSSQAWSAFGEDPIKFLNLLEEIVPDVLGSDMDFLSGLPKKLVEEISTEKPVTAGLKCELRRYQKWGVKYILHQGNVLLGDEMGLGKTIEAIASMVALKNTGATHFFVICPAGVLPNWCREIVKHSNLNAIKAHGPDKFWDFASWVKNGGVAVTTYETSGTFEFPDDLIIDMLVVDEAHYVKNPEAKRSRCVAELCERSTRALFMTGTALENRVDEMLTLINYLNPKVAEEAAQYAAFTAAEAFKESVAPVYYRRKRDDVLTELPELIENEAWCTMSEEELRDYDYFALKKDRTGMRRVSWTIDAIKRSSKMKRLKEIIADAEGDGRRVIIFSFYLDTIWDIYAELGDKAMYPITGAIKPKRRQEIIDEFNESPPGKVIISQIMAGGTGINIQAASVVVICEPQYKPSTENQAISRAYRMGQSRNVLVYRLLAEGTIDESITALLRRKQMEFDMFADKSVAGIESIEIDDRDLGNLIEEEIERIKKKHGVIGETDEKALSKLRTKVGEKKSTSDNREIPSFKTTKPVKNRVPEINSRPPVTNKEASGSIRRPIVDSKGRRTRKKKKKSFSFNVAGVVKRKTGRDWERATASQVTVVREKNNKYDKNAVALHINGWKAGYIPRNLAANVASFLDAGYTARVTSVWTEEVPERKRYKIDGDYYYEEDYSKTFHIVHMSIVLDEPGAAEREVEEARAKAAEKKAAEERKKEEAKRKPLSVAEAKKLEKLLPASLTPRQTEAFVLLSQGKTRAEISYEMGIKEASFSDYSKAIYSMFDFHSKKDLIIYSRNAIATGKAPKHKAKKSRR